MTEADVERCADALCAYQREVTAVFARREQREWSRFYLCGQLSNLERKTMEPMVLALLEANQNAVRGLQQFTPHLRWVQVSGKAPGPPSHCCLAIKRAWQPRWANQPPW